MHGSALVIARVVLVSLAGVMASLRARPLLAAAIVAAACITSARSQQDRPLVPEGFGLDASTVAALSAEWLTEDERAELRVFHGVWDERDLKTPALRAAAALMTWDFDSEALDDPAAPLEDRVEALQRAGELREALALLDEAHAAGAARSNRAIRLQAEILEGLGRMDEAAAAVTPLVERLIAHKTPDAAELVEGVRAMMVRARAQGQPARDFQTMLGLLGRARSEIDRLHWPAHLGEAALLLDKDNFQEGVAALHETLSLNPRCSDAWYALGKVALDRFDFASGATAARALRRLNPIHPLADLLDVQASLVQDDPERAAAILEPLLERHPKMRHALAYNAATAALFYDDERMHAELARFDELSPGSPIAHYVVGRHLSLNRQYQQCAEALEEAIRRAPAWPPPQIELGLMEMQSGRDDRALKALQSVAKLDPYNKRAANSLFLLEQLAAYRQIETEHFIIRYQGGVDEVMAMSMPEPLERLHAIVAGRFDFEPPQKTLIEVHPNHARFAVRITGMPFVHTIAACTGPVIAMEVPREGLPSQHQGPFDWPRVLQHEYTHTITLAQTRNRIPHWLTEAAAVSMEQRPRTYNTCLMLAAALENGTLFSLDEIKWAFVRPRRPNDRSQAYAQGHWMVEFMNERFGESALVRLLERYAEGERESQAIPAALGVSREQFFKEFLVWARAQVHAWGLDAQPTLGELTDELRENNPELREAMRASRQARLEALVRRMTQQIGLPTGEPARLIDRRGGEEADNQRATPVRERGLVAADWPEVIRPPVQITDEQLFTWLEAHPDHPDLIELQVTRRLERLGTIDAQTADDHELIALLHRYMELRPVDPMPHKRLASIWLASDTPERAIEHLEIIDLTEEHTPAYALELARLYRLQGEYDKALDRASRALHINPYSAPNRELAAAIAIEAGELPAARDHIYALTLIEPDRPQHHKRLEAVEKMLSR